MIEVDGELWRGAKTGGAGATASVLLLKTGKPYFFRDYSILSADGEACIA